MNQGDNPQNAESSGKDHQNYRQQQEQHEYIFGFGSIINTTTHAPWLKDLPNQNKGNNAATTTTSLPGVICTLKASFGYQRRWNFRSSTGFTALGLAQASPLQGIAPQDINGVAFLVDNSMIPAFDRREVGYKRVSVPLHHLQVFPNNENNVDNNNNDSSCSSAAVIRESDIVWLYIPLESQGADDNHPILQSYVDVVMQGCLSWGGQPMAEQFLLTTGGWSSYFLNDTPSSRRPWLFRKDYATIDNLLKRHAQLVHYNDRKHPEEFASALNSRMKGSWSLPRRSPNFIGRDAALEQIHGRLSAQSSSGIAKLTISGMGGVGKTQLLIEYCYRHLGTLYGLVVWLNAESSESLVADYRQLLLDFLSDSDMLSNKNDTEEIVAEVKSRLFQSQVPWLLVFDNLEDFGLLEKFCPRGSGRQGHVLVTTRLVDVETVDQEATFSLDCFEPSESLGLLKRSAGEHNMSGDQNMKAARNLAERLGHLPLALGMAAAYMLRCDTSCSDYLERYDNTGQLLLQGKLRDYSLTVSASLSLSLVAIEKESKTAVDLLRLLSFIGPDQITKKLLRSLLIAKCEVERSIEETKQQQQRQKSHMAIVAGASILLLSLAGSIYRPSGRSARGVSSMAVLSVSIPAIGLLLFTQGSALHGDFDPGVSRHSRVSRVGAISTEFEQADLIWNILKSFSILNVKEGKGSIHRLLAQSLRESQCPETRLSNLRICVDAMSELWTFTVEDTKSWKDASLMLEHVKSVVAHVPDANPCSSVAIKSSRLSRQVGVFSAVALNAFVEAQASLELSTQLLERCKACDQLTVEISRAETFHELGRVFRYQGAYDEAEDSLRRALDIRRRLARNDDPAKEKLSDTLHELGVLEAKKHRLDAAADYLQDSLDMRRELGLENADKVSAALHQLASTYVARKPPDLSKAESLLQEALGSSRQIVQRAATLKQLARVNIRQGRLERSEFYLEKALELYVELYGDNKLHINVASVKFQQGALAIVQGSLDQAWQHFSECLRIRRHVYAYARPVNSASGAKDVNPIHLEVSSVLHELACVAFAQGRFSHAKEIFSSEGAILLQMDGACPSSHIERVFQSRLTNFTWLKKCAKEMGEDDAVAAFTNSRNELKKRAKLEKSKASSSLPTHSLLLQQEALLCREQARQYALAGEATERDRKVLLASLDRILLEMKRSPTTSLKRSVTSFRYSILSSLEMPVSDRRVAILKACDTLRDTLRSDGVTVNDTISKQSAN